MVAGIRKKGHSRPQNDIIFSTDDRTDIYALFKEYDEIPLHIITLLFKARYNRILDCLGQQIDGGMQKYLERMFGNVIETRCDAEGTTYVSLDKNGSSVDSDIKENIPDLLKKRSFERNHKAFFNPDSILWRGRTALLDKRNLNIEHSLFEQTKIFKTEAFDHEVRRIRSELIRYPDGVELSKFGVRIDVSVFPGIANDHIIKNLPELFYVVERNGYEVLLFDGYTNTRNDIVSQHDKPSPDNYHLRIVEHAIQTGIYHRTLLLIREKGPSGLKIHVWQRSLERNFYASKTREEKDELFANYDQMNFFMALAKYGLVVLSSAPTIKNDLRAFVPKKTRDEIEPIFERFCRHRSNSII